MKLRPTRGVYRKCSVRSAVAISWEEAILTERRCVEKIDMSAGAKQTLLVERGVAKAKE